MPAIQPFLWLVLGWLLSAFSYSSPWTIPIANWLAPVSHVRRARGAWRESGWHPWSRSAFPTERSGCAARLISEGFGGGLAESPLTRWRSCWSCGAIAVSGEARHLRAVCRHGRVRADHG